MIGRQINGGAIPKPTESGFRLVEHCGRRRGDDRRPGGETLLHLAASVPGMHPKLVAVIADGPAAADAGNDAGETPLQVAERHGRPRIVAALRRLRGGQASGLGAGGN
jgi:hypothetical protein